MRRLKCTLQYDGTSYSGWQRQESALTVQGTLDQTLGQLTQEPILTQGASRTDAGVHALGQVAHFDDSGKFAVDRYKDALNALLPDDIAVTQIEEVPASFHARFDAQKKWYQYHLFTGRQKNIFRKNYASSFKGNLDIEKMQEGARVLLGEHDFTSFKTLTDENRDQNGVRTCYRLDIQKEGDFILFDLEANGFLYKMVRCLVGSLVEVGRGKYPPSWMEDLLEDKDRTKAGPNMPPQGLFLMKVTY